MAMPILTSGRLPSRATTCKGTFYAAKVQCRLRFASSLKLSLVWKYRMDYRRKFLYGMDMDWKKIARMKYEKIVFNSIPYPDTRIEVTFASFSVPAGMFSPFCCLDIYFI